MRLLGLTLVSLLFLVTGVFAQETEITNDADRLLRDDMPFLTYTDGDVAFSDIYVGDEVVIYYEALSNTDDPEEPVTIEGTLVFPGNRGYVDIYHPLVVTGSVVTGSNTIAVFNAPVQINHDLLALGDIWFNYSVDITGMASVVRGNFHNHDGMVAVGQLNLTGFAMVDNLQAEEVYAFLGVETKGDFNVAGDVYVGDIYCSGDVVIGGTCESRNLMIDGNLECLEMLAHSLGCEGDITIIGNLTAIKGIRCEGTLDCGGDIISGVTPFYPKQPSILCREFINGNVKYGEVREMGSDTEDTEDTEDKG